MSFDNSGGSTGVLDRVSEGYGGHKSKIYIDVNTVLIQTLDGIMSKLAMDSTSNEYPEIDCLRVTDQSSKEKTVYFLRDLVSGFLKDLVGLGIEIILVGSLADEYKGYLEALNSEDLEDINLTKVQTDTTIGFVDDRPIDPSNGFMNIVDQVEFMPAVHLGIISGRLTSDCWYLAMEMRSRTFALRVQDVDGGISEEEIEVIMEVCGVS